MMADVRVGLSWAGGLAFESERNGNGRLRIESSGDGGPSPMETLLFAAAGCSAIDVVDILEKMRVPLSDLDVEVQGERRPEPPRRYTRIRLVFRAGVAPESEAKLRRAVELSMKRYCSVVHSLRPDIELITEVTLV